MFVISFIDRRKKNNQRNNHSFINNVSMLKA